MTYVMSRDPSLRLQDIIEACDRLAFYIQGYDWERFQRDLKTQDAVVRVFEIIGEAAKGIPEEFTGKGAGSAVAADHRVS